jgi:hypothetical protein
MPTFVCKHYRRSAPDATIGTLADEITFSAPSAADAETKIRKLLTSGVAPMDWHKHFATLEDDSGHVLVTWLHGVLHA